MAYGVIPYSVDIDAVSDAFGTSHDDVKEKIIGACDARGFFESLDRSFPTDLGWPEAKTIMIEYLNGTLQNFTNNMKIWYVIELLIQGYGQSHDNGQWYPGNINPMYNFDEFRMYMISRNRKVNFNSPDGFPTVFTIEHKDFNTAINHIKEHYPEEMASEFENWTKEAAKNKQDLVLYYY